METIWKKAIDTWRAWKGVTPKNRFLVMILILAVMVCGFALLYNPVYAKYKNGKNYLSRRLNRISLLKKPDGTEKVAAIPFAVLEGEIKKTRAKAQEVKASFDELDTGFAPLDSAEMRQQLILELSTLAERTGVSLLQVSRKGYRPEGGGQAVLSVDKELGRPLLLITANAQYSQLLDFLEGLQDMSFYVSVMSYGLYSRLLQPSMFANKRDHNMRGMSNKGFIPPGSIFVSLELSI